MLSFVIDLKIGRLRPLTNSCMHLPVMYIEIAKDTHSSGENGCASEDMLGVSCPRNRIGPGFDD